MDTSTKKFSELPYKDKVAYSTALGSFVLGWILLFVGMFLPPMGEISPSVITAFGTALVYTASIFGIAIYAKSSVNDMFSKLEKEIKDKLKEDEK